MGTLKSSDKYVRYLSVTVSIKQLGITYVGFIIRIQSLNDIIGELYVGEGMEWDT